MNLTFISSYIFKINMMSSSVFSLYGKTWDACVNATACQAAVPLRLVGWECKTWEKWRITSNQLTNRRFPLNIMATDHCYPPETREERGKVGIRYRNRRSKSRSISWSSWNPLPTTAFATWLQAYREHPEENVPGVKGNISRNQNVWAVGHYAGVAGGKWRSLLLEWNPAASASSIGAVTSNVKSALRKLPSSIARNTNENNF